MRLAAPADRLFRHDTAVLAHAVRNTFVRWYDWAIVAVMLLAGVAGVRTWCAGSPWIVAMWTAIIAGAVLGMRTQGMIANRLAFHRRDGLLAVDALTPVLARRYAARWHTIGLALLATVTLIARPSLLIVSLAAYLAGSLLATMVGAAPRPPVFARAARPARSVRPWLHHPVAGVIAAALLLIGLAPFQRQGDGAAIAAAAIGTIALLLPLTLVDHAQVRFLTLIGRGPLQTIADHARSAAAFMLLAIPGGAILFDMAVGVAIVTGAATALTLLSLRIYAYRLHNRRAADLLVTVAGAMLVMTAYMLPFALPPVILALFWRLHRRAGAVTWLLA